MEWTKLQKRALDLMNSGENVFLTGNAGTGKSTIVREFINTHKYKNIIICAPSGVAAVNIGGATIHRTFKAPLEPIIHRPIKVIEELCLADIILIDEISMCRIDLFEWVVANIKLAVRARAGKRIQLIVVGDFYQLPPVITDRDRPILEHKYGDRLGEGYCFTSPRWSECEFNCINLDEVVRQSDSEYIENLDKARYGDKSCINYFNRYNNPHKLDKAIMVCPTNKRVNAINDYELMRIYRLQYDYHSEIEGDILDSDKPTSDVISLKIGARVMFITNSRDYYNGSFGTVIKLLSDTYNPNNAIEVLLDTGKRVVVSKYRWIVYRYRIKDKTLVKEEIGAFTQYPLKLAWAVTMHKSQGQTYSAINVEPWAWAPGQLYVALSRATSINAMHLEYPIKSSSLVTSPEVVNFYRNLKNSD